MEFNYRAADDHKPLPLLAPAPTPPPPPPSQPANSSFSGDHIYEDMSLGYNVHSHLGGQGYELMNEYYRNPTDLKEAIQLQMEKERIEERILMEIVTRRRRIEAEVMRQLMFETNIALQGGGGGFFGLEPQNNIIGMNSNYSHDPISHYKVEGSSVSENFGRSLQEKIVMPPVIERQGSSVTENIGRSLPEKIFMPPVIERQFSILESTPVRSEKTVISEVKPESEANKDENKNIWMIPCIYCKKMSVLEAKVETDVSAAKRKIVIQTTTDSGELKSASGSNPNKKMKQEWRCTVCNVSATCEQNLITHRQGKKHKAKEAGLGKKGKSFNIGWSPSPTNNTNSETDLTPSECKQVGSGSSLLTSVNSGDVMRIDNALLNVGKHEAQVRRADNQDNPFMFWCEMCQVGAQSLGVIEAHKAGKRHTANLQKHQQTEDGNGVNLNANSV